MSAQATRKARPTPHVASNHSDSPVRSSVGLPQDELTELSELEEADVAMTLTQETVNRLSALVGKNILTSGDLISCVTFLTCVSVEGTSISLEPGLLSRLKSRCYRTPFPEFLRATIIKQLHDFSGW